MEFDSDIYKVKFNPKDLRFKDSYSKGVGYIFRVKRSDYRYGMILIDIELKWWTWANCVHYNTREELKRGGADGPMRHPIYKIFKYAERKKSIITKQNLLDISHNIISVWGGNIPLINAFKNE